MRVLKRAFFFVILALLAIYLWSRLRLIPDFSKTLDLWMSRDDQRRKAKARADAEIAAALASRRSP